MQLIYFPALPGLNQFGIRIPVLDTRATKTIEHLRNHPSIGQYMDGLLQTECTETLSREDLARVHSKQYVDAMYSDQLERILLQAYELVDEHGNYFRYEPEEAAMPLTALFGAQLTRAAGSLQAMRTARAHGSCFYFAGGFHHAHADFGHGFCFINDIVIGIRRLQSEGAIKRAWVIDTDAHKGDGTAALTAGDSSISTLSIHMAEGWPLDYPRYDRDGKQHPSFTPSSTDIPIRSGEENRYTEKLSRGLEELQAGSPNPDLAVVVFGADPYEKDELDSAKQLKLTLPQMKQRDQLVYSFLRKNGIPVAYLMAGGYGEHAWEVYYQFLEWVLADVTGFQNLSQP